MHLGALAAVIRCFMVVVIIDYLWLAFGGSLYGDTAPPNTNRQPERFGSIMSLEGDLAFTAGPAAGP